MDGLAVEEEVFRGETLHAEPFKGFGQLLVLKAAEEKVLLPVHSYEALVAGAVFLLPKRGPAEGQERGKVEGEEDGDAGEDDHNVVTSKPEGEGEVEEVGKASQYKEGKAEKGGENKLKLDVKAVLDLPKEVSDEARKEKREHDLDGEDDLRNRRA